MIGELKSNLQEDHHRNTWLDLARYAREIFGAQDRRFVLGFTLCGSKLRAWEFDRLGGTASVSIDVHMDAKAFIKVILGFFLMTEKQLGFDPSIYSADGQYSIKITGNGMNETLQLKRMKKRSGVAGRATTCWKALRNPNQSSNCLVIKDSWQFKERPEEGLLLKMATEKGVKNVSRYFHHETIQFDGREDSVLNSVRQGLIRTNGKDVFEEDDADNPTSRDSSRSAFIPTQSLNLPQKRALSSKHSPSSLSRKKSQLMRPIHDRVHRRVVTQDAGKNLYEASSLSAFLQGIIGGSMVRYCRVSVTWLIRIGHESLLNVGISIVTFLVATFSSPKTRRMAFLSILTSPSTLPPPRPPEPLIKPAPKCSWQLEHYTVSTTLSCMTWNPSSGSCSGAASTGTA